VNAYRQRYQCSHLLPPSLTFINPISTESAPNLILPTASSEWPERKYCSDTESFFLCKLWEDFGARSLGRMVSQTYGQIE
jgi:hypothetical protein